MQHIIYFTDMPISEAEYLARKAHLTPVSYHELDDALGMARIINARGGVPWEIVSSDGKKIDRAEISRLVKVRAAELRGRPKVR